MLALTPAGIGTGFFPTRDISKHRTEDFAADILFARVVVRHYALRRRDDRNAQSIVHARQCFHRGIDAPGRFGDSCDLADHRLAVEIFELDLQLLASIGVLYGGVSTDKTLAL